jgi:hypothetical protein
MTGAAEAPRGSAAIEASSGLRQRRPRHRIDGAALAAKRSTRSRLAAPIRHRRDGPGRHGLSPTATDRTRWQAPPQSVDGFPIDAGLLGDAAAAVARTDTFLGERHRRLVRRRGKLKALVAVARPMLVIVWHLLADPTARFHDLGADSHAGRFDKASRIRNLVHRLQALGQQVTLSPAA